MKSEESQRQFMRFGQIVRIHGHCFPKAQQFQKGMVVAKGFTDHDAKYQTYQTFRNCPFYRQSLFQVLPKGIFEKPQQILSLQDKKKLIQDYQIFVKCKMGQIVKFGEQVVFKHVDSQQYLSQSLSCSNGGFGAFKVQLTRHLQKNLVFTMSSFMSYQKQGDKVKLQSPLLIKNMQNRCYISTQKNINDGISQKFNIVSTFSQKYTWLLYLHQSHQTLNQIDQIRTHDIILLTYTKNGGYLCLTQTKNDQNFRQSSDENDSVDSSVIESPFKAVVRVPLQDTEYPCYTCLWQIQKQPLPQTRDKKIIPQPAYTLRDLLTDQYLKVPLQKHIQRQDLCATGFQNIQYDQKQITIKSAKGMVNSTEYMKHNGLIKISGPKNNQIYVLDHTSYRSDISQFAFRQTMPYQLKQVVSLAGQSQHGFRISKIDQNSKRQVLFILSTYQVLDRFAEQLQSKTADFQNDVKAKQFYFIDSILQKLIAFIKDCDINQIEQDILPNKKKQYIAKDIRICQKLFMIVELMAYKVLEEVYRKDKAQKDAFNIVFARVYFLILQIIKNNPITKLYVCQGWLQIILSHTVQNQQDIVFQTLNQILQNNELVVAKFLRANNCRYLKHMTEIFQLNCPHQKFLNILRASCISNGSPIVTNQNLILDRFFDRLNQHAQFKFVKLGISEPNKLYLKCSISKGQLKARSMKDFFEQSSRLDLSQTSNYFIAYLNLLADICYGRNTQAKKYVQKILSPTIEDQQQSIDIFAEPLDALYTLTQILKDKDIEQIKGYKNLLRAVLRLINYAFVESADQNPVLRIHRYRNIDKIGAQKKGQKQKFARLEIIMNFVKQKLQNFKSFYLSEEQHRTMEEAEQQQNSKERKVGVQGLRKYQQICSVEDKQFLLTELSLLKSTLIIGYWTVQQQQKLVPLLLKVLTNSKKNILHFKQHETNKNRDKQLSQIRIFKQQASRHTPIAQLIISCKAMVCQLIQIIFDFRHDDLVTKCVSIYKQLDQKFRSNFSGLSIILQEDLEIKGQINQQAGPEIYNIKEWKKRLMGIFDQGRQNDESAPQNDSKMLVPLMVQLGIHQNPTLFFRSLLILKRHFQYRVDILKLFLNLSIYDNKSGRYLQREIAQKKIELNTLQQQNLLYTKQLGVYDNIMNFLAWLSQATKKSFSLEDRPDFNHFRCIFDHFHQRQQVDQFRQRTIKNNDLHSVMLKFIGLSRQSLIAYSNDARNMLKYVYRFLALLCKGFLQAKLQVFHKQGILSIIKDHIKQEVDLLEPNDIKKEDLTNIEIIGRRDDCEAIQLLSELFSHNKTILFNQQQTQQTCQSICDLVNRVSITNYYKSHLLDFCRSLIYYKDQRITSNQSRILAKLQDPQKKNVYYSKKNFKDTNPKQPIAEYIIDLVHEFQQLNPSLKSIKEPKQVQATFGDKIELMINKEDSSTQKKDINIKKITSSNISRGKQELFMRKEQSAIRKQVLIIGPQLTYFITLFSLFANLVEGKHIVNIGKGRQVHSYEMLINILKNCNLFYPLKTNIRNYINQLYYSTPVQQTLYNQIIKQDLPQLISDLNDIISILVKQQSHPCYQLVHPVRYRFYDTYLFLYVEQLLFSLNYLFCQSQFVKAELAKQLAINYSNGYFYLHYIIIRIYQRLRWLTQYYYQHANVRGMLNVISMKIKADYLEQFKKSTLRIFDRDEERGHELSPSNLSSVIFRQKKPMSQKRQLQLIKRCGLYLRKLVKGEIGNFFIVKRQEDQKNKNFPLTFLLPYDDQEDPQKNNQVGSKKQKQMELLAEKLKTMLYQNLQDSSNKEDHHLRLQTVSDRLWGNVSFVNFMDQYFKDNCKQLYTIDDYSKKLYNFQTPFVSFQQYIKIFVHVNNEKPQSIPNNLRIFFFKLILQFIEQQRTDYIIARKDLSKQQKDQQISKSIDGWDNQDWKNVQDKVHVKQQYLVQSSVAQLIIQSLKNAQDIELYNAILKFSIAYLLGGYKGSQDSIYQKLKQDQKNNVFIKLQKLIARLGKKITGKISQRTTRVTPPQDQFLMSALDQYDYYDPRIKGMKKFQSMNLQDKLEQQQQTLQKQVFSMIFKFLQLLCQCNHVELKTFVRQQINVNGQKKNHSFSLINVAIFQIRRLFKVMSKEASTVILPLIDFVNQVVTIPCIENQKSLVETTFFEDLCYMASFFSQEGNIQRRGFDQPISFQLLNDIYRQCILIILNVLESNQPPLIRQLLIKIKASFLLGVIQRNLSSLNIKNSQSILDTLQCQNLTQPKVLPQMEDMMDVMIVLQKLEGSQGCQKLLQEKQAYFNELQKGENNINLKQLMQTIRSQMLKIQIQSISSKKKQFVYFPNHPILHTLSPTTRDRIMLNVSRSTQRQKIRSLFNYRDEVIKQIEHNFKIQKGKLLGIIPYQPVKMLQLQWWAFLLSFIINILWFFSTDIVVQHFQVIYYVSIQLRSLLTFLDLLQLGIVSLYFISYCKCQYGLALVRHEKAKKQQEKQQQRNATVKKLGAKSQFCDFTIQQQKTQSAFQKAFITPITIIRVIITILISTFLQSPIGVLIRYDPKFLYIFGYLLSSLFTVFYHQILLLCYVLFFFMQNDHLSNVFKAITYNLRQLLSVGLLGVVFVYVFSYISFEIYAPQMMNNARESVCDSVIDCILDLFVSGKIGGTMKRFKLVRFIADLIFFVFFGLLLSNIVSGIMIDTFAELRNKRDQMHDDKKNKCYICGKDRASLQKNNQNFDEHIHQKHFLWNYIYYIYCLNSKHQTQYSGLQYQINQCLNCGGSENQEDMINWIPFNSQDQVAQTNKIIQLQKNMENITKITKEKLKLLKNSPLRLPIKS